MILYNLTDRQQQIYDELMHYITSEPNKIATFEDWIYAFRDTYHTMIAEAVDVDSYYAIEELIMYMYKLWIGSTTYREADDHQHKAMDKYVKNICALIYAERIIYEDCE